MPTFRPPDLLVIAPSSQGHHPEYVRWIIEGAASHGTQTITVAGPTDLVDHPEHFAGLSVRPSTFALPELDPLGTGLSRWEVGRRTGAAIQRAVESVQPTDVLLTYLDHAQLALATGLRFRYPVRISGILFRPTLQEPLPGTLKGRMRETGKRVLLRLASANRHLDRVFTLDPSSVEPLQAYRIQAVYLPDPVDSPTPTTTADTVRASFGIEQDRQIAVLFGSLEDRKGIFELLRALPYLDSNAASRLAVVIAGRTYDAVRPRLLEAISKAESASPVQILFHEAFLPDSTLTSLISASDLVLAPYRNHIGSSGVMLRSAAAGTPVLAPETGLMGREARQYGLGVSVDTSDPQAIARGIIEGLNRRGFDPARARDYAGAHSVEAFQRVLFNEAQ